MAGGRSVKKAFSRCFAAPRVEASAMPAENQPSGPAVVHASATSASTQPSGRRSFSGPELRKFAASQAAGRKSDQDCPSLSPQGSLTQSDMQALQASNINRQYTEDDWFAAMSALGKVKKLSQQRALQQLRLHQYPSLQDDDLWFSPRSHTISTASAAFISEAELSEVCKLAHEVELQDHQQQQLTVSPCRELAAPTPNCVPTTPLLYAGKDWKFCPVDVKPFCFYWARDDLRSTPAPLPIDEQMKLSSLGQKIHQSIAGSWFRDVGNQFVMHATPSLPGIPNAITKYTEYYNKDQTPSTWAMRRDIRVGKTVGQMFMTTDGILILRVCAYGLFSSKVEWVNEDYIRLEDNGDTIVTRQVCKVMADNSIQSQYMVARKVGTAPPKH